MDWLSIQGYEGLYEISGDKVRNSKTQRDIPTRSGHVIISKMGVPARVKVKDMVGVTYAPPPAHLQIVRGHHDANEKIRAYAWWDATKPTHVFLGDAGEILVCAELLLRGIRATFNPMAGAPYDVIGDFGEGQIFTVQVKTTSGPATSKGSRTSTYRFSSNESSRIASNIFAFVAMDTKKVVFELTEDFRASRTFTIELFNKKAETSIDTVLCKLYSQMTSLPESLFT